MPERSNLKKNAIRLAWVGAGFSVGILAGAGLSLQSALRQSGLSDSISPLVSAALIVRSAYIEPMPPEQIKERLLSGLIDSLDPHSAYLPPATATTMRQEMKGSYGGIGVTARAKDKHLLIREVQPGSPAEKAGVRAGDRVVKIAGKTLKEDDFLEAFSSIRGPIGEPVVLGLSRLGKTWEVSVKRAHIEAPSTQWGLLDLPEGGKALVIRSKQFTEKTVAETHRAIEAAMSGKAPPRAVVLDLRDNPGGLVSSAVGLSSFFLAPGAQVVSARGREGTEPMVWRALASDWASDGEDDLPSQARAKFPQLGSAPMAILVNSRSASASEIVAGAFKDWKRAPIIGVTTFGKGSVQSVYNLGAVDGAIKITTSRYYTPKGSPIQAIGVPPDLLVADATPQSYREADIPKHLKSETGKETLGDKKAASEQVETALLDDAHRQSSFSDRLSLDPADPYLAKALEALRPAKK